jgi:hypothetical protein
MSNSSVQINNNTYGGGNKGSKPGSAASPSSESSSYPGNLLQFKTHQHLQAQIVASAVAKARLPYGSPYSTNSSTSSASSVSGGGPGEVINLSNNKNRTSGGTAYSPAGSSSSYRAKSPKSSSASSSSGIGTNGQAGGAGGLFIGTTSILDNLLKNPRTHLEAAIAAAAAAHNIAAAQAAAMRDGSGSEGNDNSDMVQYEAEGYLENCRGSPHNLSIGGRAGRDSSGDHPPSYYCSPGSAGHPSLIAGGHGGGDDDNNNNMEMTMTEDNTPIPPHLLEPQVEYHHQQQNNNNNNSNSSRDDYGGGIVHNPLAELAKHASLRPPAGGGNKRGSKKNQQQQMVVDGNGEITSSGAVRATPPAKPKPKKNEAIICDICGKKFSNAYNLRVSFTTKTAKEVSLYPR